METERQDQKNLGGEGLWIFPSLVAHPIGDHTLYQDAFLPYSRRRGGCAQNDPNAKCRDHFRHVHLAASILLVTGGKQDPVAGGPRVRLCDGLSHAHHLGILCLFSCKHHTRTCDGDPQEMLPGAPPVTYPLSHPSKKKESERKRPTVLQRRP